MRTARFLIATAVITTACASSVIWANRAAGTGSAAEALAAQARTRAEVLDTQARAATQISDRARAQAAALASEVQAAEITLARADARLAAVSAARARLAQRLATDQLPTARLIAGLAASAQRPPLLAILQPGSLKDTVRLRAVMAGITPQIEQRTESMRTSLARATQLERDAAGLVAQRRMLIGSLSDRRAELASMSAAERLKALRAAGSADREAERALLLGRPRDPAEFIADPSRSGVRARLAADRAPPSYRLPVRAALPAVGPGEGGIAILRPPPGARVVAPGAGRVAFAGPYRGFRTIVIIEHDGLWTSLITGLASADVRVGQQIVAGSPIGLAPVRDPQIGLELRRGGERVDVAAVLRRNGR